MQRNINQAFPFRLPDNRIDEKTRNAGQNRKSFNNHNSFFSSFNPLRSVFSPNSSHFLFHGYCQTGFYIFARFFGKRRRDFSVPLNLVYWQQMRSVRFIVFQSPSTNSTVPSRGVTRTEKQHPSPWLAHHSEENFNITVDQFPYKSFWCFTSLPV